MHSSQAAPPPQAPPAPASAPQLTFGSTPAPTSGPGTGVVALLLLMHCIAADALLCCCCCGSHCCCHCFVLLLLLLLLVARWMHRASPLSCKSCLYSCLCCLRSKLFIETLLPCPFALHGLSDDPAALWSVCLFACWCSATALLLRSLSANPRPGHVHDTPAFNQGSAHSPGVILGHVSF